MNYRILGAIAAAVLAACPAVSVANGFHLFGAHRHQQQTVRVSGPQPAPYHWTQGAAPKAHLDMVTEFKKLGLKPGEYVWAATAPAAGDSRIVVDLLTQMAYVYRDDKLVGATTISSAKRGMVTPLGFWSILEKRPFYHSKKYDNAPMPWMQRIDSYGIAFHGGANPGYPASHGCIRLPLAFAKKLYTVTGVGTPVYIGA